MVQRAIDGYYHDYQSPLAFPVMQLMRDLHALIEAPTTGPKAKAALNELGCRVINGDFDATKEEADAWAAGPEGQEAFRELLGGGQ